MKNGHDDRDELKVPKSSLKKRLLFQATGIREREKVRNISVNQACKQRKKRVSAERLSHKSQHSAPVSQRYQAGRVLLSLKFFVFVFIFFLSLSVNPEAMCGV